MSRNEIQNVGDLSAEDEEVLKILVECFGADLVATLESYANSDPEAIALAAGVVEDYFNSIDSEILELRHELDDKSEQTLAGPEQQSQTLQFAPKSQQELQQQNLELQEELNRFRQANSQLQDELNRFKANQMNSEKLMEASQGMEQRSHLQVSSVVCPYIQYSRLLVPHLG